MVLRKMKKIFISNNLFSDFMSAFRLGEFDGLYAGKYKTVFNQRIAFARADFAGDGLRGRSRRANQTISRTKNYRLS